MIEDGPVALVAEEPSLREAPMVGQAATINDAAERLLVALAMELFAQHAD
jgi:hypothetical protein